MAQYLCSIVPVIINIYFNFWEVSGPVHWVLSLILNFPFLGHFWMFRDPGQDPLEGMTRG